MSYTRRLVLCCTLLFVATETPAAGQTPPSAHPLARGSLPADSNGDPLPPGPIARIGGARMQHARIVNQVMFTPDDKGLVSCSADGTIRLWDVATGEELRRFVGHRGPVAGIALSADGTLLASGGGLPHPDPDNDTAIRIWDTATGKELRKIVGHRKRVSSVAFTPDGAALASGSFDGTVAVWEVATGRELRRIPIQEGFIHSVAISPDGKTLASAGAEVAAGDGLRLWDLATGNEQPRLIPEEGAGKTLGNMMRVAFHSGGDFLISSSDRDQRVWTLPTRTEGWKYGFASPMGRGCPVPLAITPDWATAVFGTADPTVTLMDWASQEFTGNLPGRPRDCWCLAMDHEGKQVAAGGQSCIYVWDLARKAPIGPPQDDVVRIAVSGDGKTTATRGRSSLNLWETATGKALGSTPITSMGPVVYSPDGRTLAAGMQRQGPLLWDLPARKEPRRCDEPGDYATLVFSPDGSQLMGFRMFDGLVVVWDVATAKAVHYVYLPPNRGWFASAVFSPDGSLLAAPLRDDNNQVTARVGIWDTARGVMLRELNGTFNWTAQLAFSPDNRTLAVLPPDPSVSVRLFEVATGRRRLVFAAQERIQQHPTFFAGGRFLAAATADGVVHLWDVAAGSKRSTLTGPNGMPNGLACSADGRFLVFGGVDAMALAWDLRGLDRRIPPPARRVAARELDTHWANLAGADSEKAYQSLWLLAGAAEQGLSLLQDRLQPEPEPDPQRLARLITDLNSPKFAVRERASEELERLGHLVETRLRETLTGMVSLEVIRRVEKLLGKLDQAEWTAPQVQGLRGIEVLEQVGTPGAVQLLEKLAAGAPDGRLTREAKAALERLQRGTP